MKVELKPSEIVRKETSKGWLARQISSRQPRYF